MASNNISKYHGKVSECSCGTYQRTIKNQALNDRACNICFNRGFVAECLNCGGNGQVSANVNGADPGLGTMKSTCNCCGGSGRFGVNKPDDWKDQEEPAAIEAATA